MEIKIQPYILNSSSAVNLPTVRKSKFYSGISFGKCPNPSLTVTNKQYLFEKCLTNLSKKIKHSSYSTEQTVLDIEKKLEQKGVNIRLKNNINLAQYFYDGLKKIEEKDIPLPNNILLFPSFLFFGTCGLSTIYKYHPQNEAPIIFPANLDKVAPQKSVIGYSKGIFSSDSPYHILFHEIGHWLQFLRGFTPQKNAAEIEKYGDYTRIAETVSQRAISYIDGSEFAAELFAGQMAGKNYPQDILNLADNLNCYII